MPELERCACGRYAVICDLLPLTSSRLTAACRRRRQAATGRPLSASGELVVEAHVGPTVHTHRPRVVVRGGLA